MLPLSIVLSCLERSLVEKAHVDVSPRGDGSLSLKLTIEVEFAAPILYVFNLTAVGVDLVHVLEAKMRDCDAAIESLSSSSKSKDVVIAKLFDMLEAVKTDVAQLRGVVGRNHELAAVMPNGAAPPKDVLARKAAPVVFDVDDMPLARDRDDAQRYPKRAKKDKPSKTPTDSANGDK
ncbi:hypothetical protein SDRG_05908 [Saprolegnia diclina VS20]|uniref:Uncharacterized protein n=1 Tax=Saprolegnia diclina (strain VS20) TaxID=1156394 RepID=T0RVM0_SAPDV|nr:hypothetical protein SDRG_05908 [Saprolegnia diclina VS20]EQC36453.1 hypothetical protein SDRG_05908 [Saprolegnia diclina VS20]|eukprot:XP_008609874.1 hypothetical protein SDRG_05908 [Saprolegnia diclina VS20]